MLIYILMTWNKLGGLAVSRSHKPDTFGWSFTESGKYSVKSWFRVKSLYPDRVQRPLYFGPNIKHLLAFSWKLKCPPKLRHFVWHILSGTLPVSKNLKAREIDCDTRCSMCGVDEESTNHVLFECPTALQTWALSRILPLRQFFHHLQFSLVWIIYSGDCRRRMFLVISLEYYGIYGRQEMIRFTRTEMETRWRFFGWLTWNVRRLN